MLKEGTCWCVGNGASILARGDPWLCDRPTIVFESCGHPDLDTCTFKILFSMTLLAGTSLYCTFVVNCKKWKIF